jgi:HlyD family secretion protein
VLVVRDGRVERVAVTLGLRGDDRIEIAQGLEPGALVVTEGQAGLVPGQRARPAAQGA